MKKNSIFRLGCLLLFAAFALNSCVPEENDPNADPRDKFVGSWLCSETSTLEPSSTFSVTIAKSASDPSKITIANFYQLGSGVRATVTVNASGTGLTINSQNVDGNQVSGSGTANGSSAFSLSYSVYDGASTNQVSDSFTK